MVVIAHDPLKAKVAAREHTASEKLNSGYRADENF
jgi:hypothetical protein